MLSTIKVFFCVAQMSAKLGADLVSQGQLFSRTSKQKVETGDIPTLFSIILQADKLKGAKSLCLSCFPQEARGWGSSYWPIMVWWRHPPAWSCRMRMTFDQARWSTFDSTRSHPNGLSVSSSLPGHNYATDSRNMQRALKFLALSPTGIFFIR